MAVAPFVSRNHGGHVGLSSPRADGREKLRGEAHFAVEHNLEGVLYGFPVQVNAANGRIASIDSTIAEVAPGVVAVLTKANAPAQAPYVGEGDVLQRARTAKPALDRVEVQFHGQIVALVVAESFESAREAAATVRVVVEGASPTCHFQAALEHAYVPDGVNGGPSDTSCGDVETALATAAVVHDAVYDTPYAHNNAMEPHGAVAQWRDGRLLVEDSNQSVSVCAVALAATFQLDPSQVQVKSRFVGGGFGAKFGLHPHVVLAALGAKATGRPVKVALTRQQTFTAHGHRSCTRQRVRLGAERDGILTALSHESWAQTSQHDEFVESSSVVSRVMYAAPNRLTRHRVTRVHAPTPSYMRAPGEAPGSFALESAMDELAFALGMDPISLRRLNEPERHPQSGAPWSSRSLQACLEQGAARFGWADRRPTPGLRRDGRWLLGLGVAGATYPSFVLPAMARLTLRADATARLEMAAADIGTGAFTVLRQLAAEALGLALSDIDVEIGDSDLPMTTGAAGSSGMASFGSALAGAAAALQARLAALARNDAESPLRGVNSDDLVMSEGRIAPRDHPARGESLRALLGRVAPQGLTVEHALGWGAPSGYASYSFGAQFAEVGVDMDTGEVRARRLLGAFGVGRVLNPLTANSQFIGGVTMGLGQALMEETHLDPRWGQWINRDLGEYHIPAHADVPAIEAFAVEEIDPHVNALGAKGIGEIGIVGVAAAIANAVFNACGVRVRDLPITVDKVLAGLEKLELLQA